MNLTLLRLYTVNILVEGSYLGHPNALRAAAMNDPRQCRYRNAQLEEGDENWTAPLVMAYSSMGAIIEFQADSFGGQMRGDLIYSKYKNGLHRVILETDGLSVIPESKPPIILVGNKGLGVTQAPDGSLIEVQYSVNELWVHQADEPNTTALSVRAVFPRRGGLAGGNVLSIYGVNFIMDGQNPTVTVGGLACPVMTFTDKKITCTLPGGTGTKDVVVQNGANSYTFRSGYRYIRGTRQ